ncbi:hypothetical protein ABIE26_001887 [Pedobacter africanus]|uniref:Uncharacterized protein n=1 Tax=Pedobacter africanus TaxID=151894 RepID=A0ACC6KR10_9SPHI|nr:hypothetical protein [Pedobacter africanus]MDR6781625.1 hypothetical protein [Pedobacter africanus]
MKELILLVEVVFLKKAEESFSFPITAPVRLSFWITDDRASTFSELQIENDAINIGKVEIVKILLLERDFLLNRIKTGTEFRLGTFPEEIAIGKVIKIQSSYDRCII